MSGTKGSIVEAVLYNSTIRLVTVTVLVFVVVNVLRLLVQQLQQRWDDENKLRDFEQMKHNSRHWLFGHTAMVSSKPIYHLDTARLQGGGGVVSYYPFNVHDHPCTSDLRRSDHESSLIPT